MAFQNVKNNSPKATGDAVKLTQIKVGDSVTGYVVKLVPSLQNPDNMNILMKDEKGAGTFYVYTAGNIKYIIKDGLVKAGLLTRITRIADKMVGGKKSSQFSVEQDPDNSLEDGSFNEITSISETTESNNNSIRQATERASVKAQAARLSAQVANKKQGA